MHPAPLHKVYEDVHLGRKQAVAQCEAERRRRPLVPESSIGEALRNLPGWRSDKPGSCRSRTDQRIEVIGAEPGWTRGLLALAFLILVSNALAYFCWFRIIRLMPASVASLTTLVVPCIGFGSSALMTGAPVSWLDAIALALIVAAVALALMGPRTSRSAQES
jgi:hypothetical protein